MDDAGEILGLARSDFKTEAIRACFETAGMDITPLSEWVVGLPMRQAVANATLYVTLEPSTRRRGEMAPPVTSLIRQVGVKRVVFGCPSPVPEKAYKGAEELYKAGIEVGTTPSLEVECREIITDYAELANSKLQHMAREHFAETGRPIGFLHCSVVESDNFEAFARNGNAFGTNFGSTTLSYRNFGSYGLAPPPDVLWIDFADKEEDASGNEDGSEDKIFDVDFEEEGSQELVGGTPIMPWYEQADAIVATFPRVDNGGPIVENESLASRLNGLKWLARASKSLPAGVERILVLDATELRALPINNDDPNVGPEVDIEAFWKSPSFRKRVLLRRGVHEAARAAAAVAAEASKAAAKAAQVAADALELGDALRAAESAQEYQAKAQAAHEQIQRELEETQSFRRKLEDMGVVVEVLEGGEPIDVMEHLGKRNGIYTVVWRAGCWGARGVKSILDGAFQMVSAHLAVDAIGGQFWQLMIAENAIQEACGPRGQVKVLADDINLEYCDDPAVDADCALRVEDGKPVRHVRVDCRVALVDGSKHGDILTTKTEKMSRKHMDEQAPWFL